MLGKNLSHYRIVEQIGAGGMGVVFLAHDQQLERDVAIKILPPGTLADEAARKRFRQEALSLAKLNHPNIATIHDFDTADQTDFLVTEYIAGESLDKKLASGALPSKEVVRLGLQLAQGLAAAHARGIIHRDLKPANLRLTTDGRLKILDFGLAQFAHPEGDLAVTASLTSSQQITGTLPYMSPEQLRGEPSDRRTDIWAAGAVLYELSTGRRPFPETHGPLLINAILNHEPELPSKVNPQISAGLESVIWKALRKNRAERYQSVGELERDLERLTAGVSPQTRGPARPLRQRLLLWGMTLLVLFALGVYFFRHHTPGVEVRLVPAAASRSSVAILGFKNLSGRPDTAWLSTALSEMLTSELAAGEKLLTISGENVARVKNDLSLPETDTLAADTLSRVRKNLGSDFVILGSYLDLGDGSGIRVDLRVQDAKSGQIVSTVTRRGSEAHLDELITLAGSEVRGKLGVGPTAAAEEVAVKAELPANVEAARFYSEGLQKLRNFEPLAARDQFEKAVAADPRHAMSYAYLASAWKALGYDQKAAAAAQKAVELSSGLSREGQLRVQGQYYEASHQWDKAIETYRSLYRNAPDNLDYGLRLANAQIAASKVPDALATLAELRKLPAPQGQDLRIDVDEIMAANEASDYKRTVALAADLGEKAKQQGARYLVAKSLQFRCAALRNLGDPKGAIEMCREGQNISAAIADRAGQAAAINTIANALYDLGNLAGARKMYDQSGAIYRALGNKAGVAAATDNAASVISDQGDLITARKMSEQALALYREVGDQTGIGQTLNNLAAQMVQAGDLAAAEKNFLTALDIWRAMGSPDGIATALTNLGDVRMALGEIAGASSAYQESLETFRKNGEMSKSAYPLVGMGDVYAASGDFANARKSYEESLALSQETGEKHESSVALANLGSLAMQQGDLTGAREKYQEAIKLREGIGEQSGAADISLLLASLSIAEGKPAEGETLARKALDEFRRARNTESQISAHAILAQALLAQGKSGAAGKEITLGRSLAAKTQQRLVRLQFEIAGAEVRASADLQSAAAVLNSVALEAEKRGIRSMVYEARLALGKAEMKYGNQAEGRAHLATVEKEAASSGFVLVARKAATLRMSGARHQTSDLDLGRQTWTGEVLAAQASRRPSRGFLPSQLGVRGLSSSNPDAPSQRPIVRSC
ncbi:MAG: tetratricopeptide repeat protein [Terriglobales bacterium]